MSEIIEQFNLPIKVLQELTVNQDKFFTIHQLHAIFYDKYDEFRGPLKREFIEKLKLIFLTIEGEYNNVYRIIKEEKHYLIWSLRSKEEILREVKVLGESDFNNIRPIKPFEKEYEIVKDLDDFSSITFNPKEQISKISEMISRNDFSFMFKENLIDGKNHPIHILISSKQTELLTKLCDLIIVDFSLKNADGKNCIELAKETKDVEMVEFVVTKTLNAKIEATQKINDQIKEAQKKSYEQINELRKNLSDAKEENKVLKDRVSLNYLKTIVMFACVALYLKTLI